VKSARTLPLHASSVDCRGEHSLQLCIMMGKDRSDTQTRPLDPKAFTRYLTRKYAALYDLSLPKA
jgi:hypothetical protein